MCSLPILSSKICFQQALFRLSFNNCKVKVLFLKLKITVNYNNFSRYVYAFYKYIFVLFLLHLFFRNNF